jgi:hypothetical protein
MIFMEYTRKEGRKEGWRNIATTTCGEFCLNLGQFWTHTLVLTMPFFHGQYKKCLLLCCEGKKKFWVPLEFHTSSQIVNFSRTYELKTHMENNLHICKFSSSCPHSLMWYASRDKRGFGNLMFTLVVCPRRWFICLLDHESFHFVPCFPLIWVLWLIYDW